MSLDARTLLLLGGLLCWLLAATIEFQTVRPSGGRPWPGAWTIGLIAQGLGLNLLSQRGLIGDVWSIAVANTLLLAAPLFFYSALQNVRGARPKYWLVAAVPISVGVLLWFVGYAHGSFALRVFVFTGAALFVAGLVAWSAARTIEAGYVAGGWLILGSTLTLAAVAVARAFSVATGSVSGIFAGHGVQVAFYALNDLCIVLGAFGYMDIARARLVEQPPRDSALQPDSLTGLYSRASFMRAGLGELRRARQQGYSVGVMMIQIDGFDALRAAHGRIFAEQALKRVAATVQREIRLYDLATRLSKIRICVLMPELPLLVEGAAIAEHIRAAVERDPMIHEESPVPTTISVGLCQAEVAHEDLEAMMSVASACLEEALFAGSNRVLARPSSFQQGSVGPV